MTIGSSKEARAFVNPEMSTLRPGSWMSKQPLPNTVVSACMSRSTKHLTSCGVSVVYCAILWLTVFTTDIQQTFDTPQSNIPLVCQCQVLAKLVVHVRVALHGGCILIVLLSRRPRSLQSSKLTLLVLLFLFQDIERIASKLVCCWLSLMRPLSLPGWLSLSPVGSSRLANRGLLVFGETLPLIRSVPAVFALFLINQFHIWPRSPFASQSPFKE